MNDQERWYTNTGTTTTTTTTTVVVVSSLPDLDPLSQVYQYLCQLLAGPGPCKPSMVMRAYPRAREQMLPYHKEAQNFPA